MKIKRNRKVVIAILLLVSILVATCGCRKDYSNKGNTNNKFGVLKKLDGVEFTFTSGAGGWRTILKFKSDGTFKGEYTDSNLGETGSNYPKGTIYKSTFSGNVKSIKKVGEFEYKLIVKDTLKLEKQINQSEIKDGIRYIYSEPYGLENIKAGSTLSIVAPGYDCKQLNDEERSWINSISYVDKNELKNMPSYAIINKETDYMFCSEFTGMKKNSRESLNKDKSSLKYIKPAVLAYSDLDSGIYKQISFSDNMLDLGKYAVLTKESDPDKGRTKSIVVSYSDLPQGTNRDTEVIESGKYDGYQNEGFSVLEAVKVKKYVSIDELMKYYKGFVVGDMAEYYIKARFAEGKNELYRLDYTKAYTQEEYDFDSVKFVEETDMANTISISCNRQYGDLKVKNLMYFTFAKYDGKWKIVSTSSDHEYN